MIAVVGQRDAVPLNAGPTIAVASAAPAAETSSVDVARGARMNRLASALDSTNTNSSGAFL